MLAPKLDRTARVAPLALVVFDDESLSTLIQAALRARGYRTFMIESNCSDGASLAGLEADVVVVGVRRDHLSIARTLVDLSRRATSPPVLLVGDESEAARVAARFKLLSIASTHLASDLAGAVERTRAEQRRPCDTLTR